tara:strand:+ start:31 stop:912 length:882 start_codon:yes stop_codon:yes gene_type:complete
MIGFGQQTYVPDDDFEWYLEDNGMGNGVYGDDYILTSNIINVDTLILKNLIVFNGISDLTGIEDFSSLKYLDISYNFGFLTTVDLSSNTYLVCLISEDNGEIQSYNLSNNTALEYLDIGGNLALTYIDLSANTALKYLDCGENDLINLNLSNNTALEYFSCHSCHSLTSLDLSNNNNLDSLFLLHTNSLYSLDIRNGNNTNMVLSTYGATNLTCINVDDVAWANANWTVANFNIDPQHYFSTNCPPSAIDEHFTNKELHKVTDLLGRETKGKTNEPLFYIYDDGTVEKRITID